MKRRKFIQLGAVGSLAGAHLLANSKAKNALVISLAMAWPLNAPILSDMVKLFKKQVEALSGGGVRVDLYPAGKLVPSLGVFDAVSLGKIDAYHAAPYYWEGKNTAFSIFSGIPFGMIDHEINAWLFYGEGLGLWREIAERYNLMPFPGGGTNIQMSGWYKKEIHSLNDFKGLKIRMVGLGGLVLNELGAAARNIPPSDLVPNLQRGVLDAVEWVSPAFDIYLGIHKIAPFYYAPWQEAGSITEFVFNKQKWDSYPKEVQHIIEFVSKEVHFEMALISQHYNAIAAKKLQAEGAKFRSYSPEVLAGLKAALEVVLEKESQKNPDFQRVLASYQSFQKQQEIWTQNSLASYLAMR